MEAERIALSPEEAEQCARIKETLVNCLLERRSVQATVQEAAVLTGCPIILTSSSYRVITMADLGTEVDDPIWQDSKRTGYCSADAVRRFDQEGVTREVQGTHGPMLLSRGLAQKMPRVLQQIPIHGRIGAYIGLYLAHREFRESDLILTDYISRILSVMLEQSRDLVLQGLEVRESILSDLLSGVLFSDELLHDRMEAVHWTPKPCFRCVLFTAQSESGKIENADYLSQVLTQLIPNSFAFPVQDGLFLLINSDRGGVLEEKRTRLTALAEEYRLYASVSILFRDLIHLRAYYGSCLKTSVLTKKLRIADRITLLEDVFFPLIADSLSREERLALVQADYKELEAYDRSNNTDYCQTLKTYFEHGCSATNAAAALYVHRNTLTKRLARITEICGLDPSDGKALMHFYMSSYLRAL